MRNLLMISVAGLTFAAAWVARSAAADPSASIPADAIAAVGWAGMDGQDPAYAESRLKAMLDATDLGGRLQTAFVDMLEESVRQGNDEVQLGIDLWHELYPVAWRRPWAIYFQGVTTHEPKEVAAEFVEGPDGVKQMIRPAHTSVHRTNEPRLGFIIEPGDDAAAVGKWMLKLYTSIKQEEPDLDLTLVQDGQRIALLLNSQLNEDPAAGLTATPRFTESFGDMDAPKSVWVFADVAAGRALVHELMRQHEQDFGPDASVSWMAALLGLGPAAAELGTDKLDRIAWAGGFNERDWEQSLFVAAPAPRVGLLALLDQAPLDPASVASVPNTAKWMRASQFDVAGAWDTVVNCITQLEPRAAEEIAEFTGEFRQHMGFDLRADLIDTLGDTWTFYADASFGGMFGSGVALVQEVENPERLGQTLTTLTNMLNEQLIDEGAPFQFTTQEQGGVTLHTMMLPFVQPTWAVVDGRLVIGLSAQTIAAARDHAQSPETSLIQNPPAAAVALRDRFGWGPDSPRESGMSYTDYAKTAPDLYQGYTMGVGLLGMQAGSDLPFNPATLLPPLTDFTDHMAPGASVSWVDDAGYHQRSISPFPGASMLSQDVFIGGPVPMSSFFFGMTAPAVAVTRAHALEDVRAEARQVQSISNLRQLSIGLHAYAADHDGQTPEALGQLYADHYVGSPDVFLAPQDPNQVHIGGPPNDHTLRLIREHGSYIYIRPAAKLHQINDASGTILIVEHPRMWTAEHAIAFADGHVEVSHQPDQTRQRIEQQSGQPLEHWVELAARAQAEEPTVESPTAAE